MSKTYPDDECLTGQKYGLAPTTWAFCWRCGKAINPRHSNEVVKGVHTKCETRWFIDHQDELLVQLQIGDCNE